MATGARKFKARLGYSRSNATILNPARLVIDADRRKQGALREGMREGFTLGQYLMLVDYTSRLVRDGKAAVTAEVVSIFTRLGSSAESWGARLLKLSGARLLGRFLSASRDRLREIAKRIGVRHLVNVG